MTTQRRTDHICGQPHDLKIFIMMILFSDNNCCLLVGSVQNSPCK